MQLRSPPSITECKCLEEKFPSILDSRQDGSPLGGLYIETIRKELLLKEIAAAAMSSDMIWWTGLGLKILGHQIAALALLPG